MKTVIVAEKKSVAEDLVKALLNGRAETHDGFYSWGEIAITYCRGHLVCMAEPHEYPGKNWLSWQFILGPPRRIMVASYSIITGPCNSGRNQTVAPAGTSKWSMPLFTSTTPGCSKSQPPTGSAHW